jgi:hypothetical protein
VRDVEETDAISTMQMLLDNAIRIEDGHVIACEGDHLSLEDILMVGMKMCGLKGLGGRELSSCLSESFTDHLYICLSILYINYD